MGWKLLVLLLLFDVVFMKVIIDKTKLMKTEDFDKTNFIDVRDLYQKESEQMERPRKDITLALNLPYTRPLSEYPVRSDLNAPRFYASAAAIAIQDINANPDLLRGYQLKYYWNKTITDTHCNEETAVKNFKKQMTMNFDGFIGYQCSCTKVGRLAAQANLPLFSMGCQEEDLSNKTLYPTFSRTTNLNPDVSQMIKMFLKKQKIKELAVIYQKDMWIHIEGNGNINMYWEKIYKDLKKNGSRDNGFNITLSKEIAHYEYFDDEYNSQIFESFLKDCKSKTKVIMVMLEKGRLQHFMMTARKMNMTNGDYVFIAVHPFATAEQFLRNTQTLKDYVWVLPWSGYYGDGNKEKAFFFGEKNEMMEAFSRLFVIQPKIPRSDEDFKGFQKRVVEGMSKEPFQSDAYERTFIGQKKGTKVSPPPEAHQLYDAVMLYAHGLNKTLSKGYSVTNGSDIIQNILNTRHISMLHKPQPPSLRIISY
eukprot:TCONS_00026970-protein